MIILGAGLAGCLAGVLDRNAMIYEAGPGISSQHKAVLRFREDSIGHAIGVPFKKVTVRKAIVLDGSFLPVVTPLTANMYAQKVTGKITERSINNLDAAERFVAPSNLHEIMGDICGSRITFNLKVDSVAGLRDDGPMVSTIPMPSLLKILGIETPHKFEHASIHVERWRIIDCDVNQTIYFPGPETGVYRATLTGEDLIIEGIKEITSSDGDYIKKCFHLTFSGADFVSRGSQRFGKILPLMDDERKELLLRITLNHRIYSLGRFACWRNSLLDDVYHDFRKIQQMIKLNHYDLMKEMM